MLANKVQEKSLKSREIAIKLMKARSKGEKAFPSDDIQSLVEIASKVVAHNFELYPEL